MQSRSCVSPTEPGGASRQGAVCSLGQPSWTAASFLGARYTLWLCTASAACIWDYSRTCMAVHLLGAVLDVLLDIEAAVYAVLLTKGKARQHRYQCGECAWHLLLGANTSLREGGKAEPRGRGLALVR